MTTIGYWPVIAGGILIVAIMQQRIVAAIYQVSHALALVGQ